MSDVTVIIPAFNAEKTIKNALTSVFEQTYKPKKIIIINDGSTDSTKQIVEDFALKNTEIEIELINQKNSGVSHSRNVGIKKASTKYIAFLDSDDAWHKKKIEKQMNALKTNKNSVFVSTSSTVKKYFSNQTYTISYPKLLIQNHVITSSALTETKIAQELLFNEKLKRAEDYNLWLKIARKGKMIFIDEKLVFFAPKRTFGASGLSANFHALTLDEIRGFLELFTKSYINFGELCLGFCSTCLKYVRKCIIAYLT